VVLSTHALCSGRTRVVLPAAVPARAVRRVVCDNCERTYETAEVVEVKRRLPGVRLPRPDVSLPGLRLPGAERLPISSLDRRWITLPVAALAVFAVLSLVNGSENAGDPAPAAPAQAAKTGAAPAGDSEARRDAGRKKPEKTVVPSDAQLVSESTFSLALPAGWDRVKPAAGATFAAVSPDGLADATLWVQSDPKLDLASFEASSLAQLEALAGSAKVVERQVGPTVESSTITLAPKSAGEGAPTYEVVLRGAGQNWYYLATTHQAGAPSQAISDIDLIQGSFVPQGAKK
jgi:hypothetical protein